MQGEVFKIRVKETNEIFAAKVYYTKDEEQIFLVYIFENFNLFN